MAAKSDVIELPISTEEIRSIHNAYRYHLAGLPLSALDPSADAHNNKLAQLLTRFIFQRYLRESQIPYSTQQQVCSSDPVGNLIIGGRIVRFFIRFVTEIDSASELTLTKHQVDHLTEADDINIFADLIRRRHTDRSKPGAYYFLPPLPEDHRSKGKDRFIQTDGHLIKLCGLGTDLTPFEVDLQPTAAGTLLIPSELSKLVFLFCSTRPVRNVRVSTPPSSYFQISPADWSMIGITADQVALAGWLPSFHIKRLIQDRLSIDTEFRIRYFKTERCSISRAELHPLPRLLALAKQLDKGS